MLQLEEDKILKKITQTRKRAEEIMLAKQRNDEHFQIRMKEKEYKMKMEEKSRKKFLNDRVQRQVNKEKTIKAIKRHKREEFKLGKTMTLRNDMYKKEFNNEVMQENYRRKLMIREEEELRAEKLRQMEEEK